MTTWFEQDHIDCAHPLPDTAVREIAQPFARYRPAHERTIEFEALEVVRSFLDSFPDLSQKQMLYALLAGGMHHVISRGLHATPRS
ncbi:hypothetical protein ACH4FX_31280 [Streptomyces sp. NPDC018019]|uniref:hypothetical protein n=1 Tax=Streptomyces sp. NPDC018019 TaxID=3365030 RepID=UPI00379BDFB2